jgi:alpha-mannosidase
MPHPLESAVAAFETFNREVVAPAMIAARSPLEIGVFQSREPVPAGLAARATFKPVRAGWEWGPKWSTAWFRLRGKLPELASSGGKAPANAARELGDVHLRFSTDTEAQLWVDGVPHQGLDVNRDLARLPSKLARGSGRIELLVEAACNHPFGAVGLQWDTPDTQRRWASDTPGRLLYAELVRVDRVVWTLHHTLAFATGLLRELIPPAPPMFTPGAPWAAGQPMWQSSRAEQLHAAVRSSLSVVDPRDVCATAAAALRPLEEVLTRVPVAGSSLVGHSVGHAHIDTAWLWPLRETRRKCVRTFSNVLRLMDRDAEFRFMCSQAQQYAYVEQDAPELFRQIGKRVREGRWEPVGAMWIEPDANVPSAESLIRQGVHGVRWWRSRFPDAPDQRICFLPDTFGFPAQLPQIMRQLGLDTFITNKMSWNDTNPYPHTTFTWRGLDGSEVLAHCTPNHDYNAGQSPRELRRAEFNHRTKQIPARAPSRGRTGDAGASGARFLNPFGLGDGGGGPTEAMLLSTRLSERCDGLPTQRFSTAHAFASALHDDVLAARDSGVPIPEHHGELYLELHRGTLTSQAWLKRANRQAEEALRLAEILFVQADSHKAWSRAERDAFARDLDEAWKLTLLNQFHDILPGSSITWVYDDARRDHAIVQRLLRPHVAAAVQRIGDAAQATSGERELSGATHLVVNPSSVAIDQPVLVDGELRRVTLPALGNALVARAASGKRGARADGAALQNEGETLDAHDPCTLEIIGQRAILDNGRLRVEIDLAGHVLSVRTPEASGASTEHADGPLNELVLYDDRPAMWDAWDIDATHADHARPETSRAAAFEVVSDDPLRVGVCVERTLGAASSVRQVFTLGAGAERLEIATRIGWREDRRLLRASFPAATRSREALVGTQAGFVERSTRRDTPQRRAAFEVPVQRWMMLADERSGLAVLTESQYGASLSENTLALSLLRSPVYPDPTCDRGVHEFSYAIMACTRGEVERVIEQAEQLARPVLVFDVAPAFGDAGKARGRAPQARTGLAAAAFGPRVVSQRGGVEVMALTPSYDTPGATVLRVAERVGVGGSCEVSWPAKPSRVRRVDALERPVVVGRAASGVSIGRAKAGGSTTITLTLKPFEIATFLIER